MKLEDIPKKQPFKMPDESHFDSISSKIYAQIEEEKSISISSHKAEETKTYMFWQRPNFMEIAATLLLLLVALAGIYTYSSKSDTNLKTDLAINKRETKNIDFSTIPTEQINDFLLNEDISESELISFMPQNFSLEITPIFEESNLNSIDAESLDLLLEEEYL